MVWKGKLGVELVDASTRRPFKEHIQNRNIYVEVEPGVDYFVHVTSYCICDVIFEIFIDGCRIENDPVVSQGSMYCGIRSQQNGIGRNVSLKFKKLSQELRSGYNTSYPSLTGKVKVVAYKAFNPQEGFSRNYTSSWTGGSSHVHSVVTEDLKRNLKSDRGNITEKIKLEPNSTCFYFSKGYMLNTFELNYCTAVGLIDVGVLREPPIWDYMRMVRPYKKQKHGEINIHPAYITMKTTGPDGKTYEERKVEEFDLTMFESSDESSDESDSEGGREIW